VTPAELRNYISVKEAAALLGVSQGAIRKWAHAGMLRAYTIEAGGYYSRIRVHRDDVVKLAVPVQHD